MGLMRVCFLLVELDEAKLGLQNLLATPWNSQLIIDRTLKYVSTSKNKD